MSKTVDSTQVSEFLLHLDGLKVREHEPLAGHVTMGVGGPARWFVRVESAEALGPLITGLGDIGVDWYLLGGGSNTIFTDKGYPGVVVSLGRDFRSLELDSTAHMVIAGAAANLSAVMKFSQRAGLAGLEFSAGIPGKLGGALAGNAGTIAGDICSLLAWVEVIESEGHLVRMPKEAVEYGYRNSNLRGRVIVRAALSLCPDDPESIARRMDAAMAKRMEQPVGVRCSGCIFKNPPGDHAGRLIDSAGLKGLRIGGAHVSEQHANFILNEGRASASDIEKLIDTVRERIREQFNVTLEPEIRMVGLDSS